jgi:hypothetical protein
MIEMPEIQSFERHDLSLEAIDQNRATLEALIQRCQRTIAEAARVLEQLDVERKRLASLSLARTHTVD